MQLECRRGKTNNNHTDSHDIIIKKLHRTIKIINMSVFTRQVVPENF